MATLNLTVKNSSQATVLTGTVTYDVTVTAKQYVYYFRSTTIKNVSSARQDFRYYVSAGGTTFESDVSPSLAAGETLTSTAGAARNPIAVDRGATAANGLRFFVQSYTSGTQGTATHTVQPRESWTVTFNANGGTGGPTTQSKTNGAALTLTTSKPTRAGYAFAEWNTAADHGGTTYMPGGSYATDADVTLYAIWDPVITYYPNGGSGSAQTQQKPVRTAATLKGASTFARPGYAFDAWNTAANGSGTRYAAGASYSTNASLALYAQWLKEPNPPTISALSVVRVDANGNADDEGLFGKVSVTWSVDLTSQTVGGANRGTLLGAYVASSNTSQATSLAWTGTWQDATGGTATATFPASLDEQYLVLVTVTDARNTSSKVDVLTRAQFVMDFRKGGKAIGIGSAAPQDGLLIGWGTEIIGDLDVSGGIDVQSGNLDRDSSYSSIVEGDGGVRFLDSDGDLIGRVYMLKNPSDEIGMSFGVYNSSSVGFTLFSIKRTSGGGTTYYLSDAQNFRSAIAALSTGDNTVTGLFKLKTPSINRDGTAPSSTVYDNSHCVEFTDADNENIGRVRMHQDNNGYVGITMQCRNEKTDGTEVINEISASVGRNGTRTYGLSDPAAFRNALGASSGTFPTSVGGTGITSNPSMLVNLGSSSAAGVFAASPRPGVTGTLPRGNGGTGMSARTPETVTRDGLGTDGTITVYSNGVTCTLAASNVKLKAALATGSTVKIATLPAGYRPPMNVFTNISSPSQSVNGGAWVRVNSEGVVTLGNYSGAQFTTSTQLYFTITWAL